jgi:hypothetical protein
MITEADLLLYSQDPEADHSFFRDILEFQAIDLGDNWLILALPTEMADDPGNGNFVQFHAERQLLEAVLYLMFDDLPSLIPSRESKHDNCSPIVEAGGRTHISELEEEVPCHL